MKKEIKIIITIIMGFLLTSGALKIFEIPSNYLVYEAIVKSVERNNQNVYFEFYGDYKDEENEILNKYSFTEYDGITADYVVESIKVGDTIKVTVEEKNKNGNFDYILIQKAENNGNIIFDSIEYYQNHNINLRLIFIPTIIIISLFLIIMFFVDFEKSNNISSFLIRNPKWQFSFFAVATLFGSVIPIIFTFLLLIGRLFFNTYQFSFVFYIFLVLGIFGLICYFRTGVKYDSSNYYFYQLFKKTKKIGKRDIEKVLIDMTGKRKNKSGLYCRNDQQIIGITSELNHYLSKKYFINSLKENGTKFTKLVLDNNGREIEKEIKL